MTTKVSTTWLQCWTTNKQKIACDLSLCVQDIQYIQWEQEKITCLTQGSKKTREQTKRA